jgi:tRNA-Thr(GGU) m(6)t(6)A37 methyltransferase TsaA
LTGLEPGNRILVLYWLDRANRTRPLVAERRSGKIAGAFAARTPHRPNPIGAAVVVIDGIDGAVLKVRGLDCMSGTPLIDIKPAMRATRQSEAAHEPARRPGRWRPGRLSWSAVTSPARSAESSSCWGILCAH